VESISIGHLRPVFENQIPVHGPGVIGGQHSLCCELDTSGFGIGPSKGSDSIEVLPDR
jgi:hypothetical protein